MPGIAKRITFRSPGAVIKGTITKLYYDYEGSDVIAANLLELAPEGWIIFAEQHLEQGLREPNPLRRQLQGTAVASVSW